MKCYATTEKECIVTFPVLFNSVSEVNKFLLLECHFKSNSVSNLNIRILSQIQNQQDILKPQRLIYCHGTDKPQAKIDGTNKIEILGKPQPEPAIAEDIG